MTEYSRSARETLRLPGDAETPLVAPWAVFDPDWYRSRYPDAPDAGTLEWHLTTGQTLGHSPNLYFDEAWQRQTWPGILPLIDSGSVRSAFDAWCRGPHATRAPHWLFEPREYRTRYPAITEAALADAGFVNRYHHYLHFGAAERRIGHALFDPAIYLAGLDPAETEAAEAMPFRHYLRGLEMGAQERRTSIWFDLEWYRDRYPQAVESVRAGTWRSLLEHYLRNDRPTAFDPSPWFSEDWYLANNPGLAKMIGADGFRNGFAHFRAHGLAEARSPHPDLDLEWYGKRDDVRADMATGRAPDPFTHWIALGHPGLPGRPPHEIVNAETVATTLPRRRLETVLPQFARRKLDFNYTGSPAISAIVTVADDPTETLTSLISLRSHYGGAIELILIGTDSDGFIEAHVTGATSLRFDTAPTDAAARDAGLICAAADAILLLGKGIELAPRTIEPALARLSGEPTIGAVGGRLIQPHGVLLAAGGIIWGDGTLQDYARDASPLAGEANFVRDTDFCSTAFLLARRDVLTSLPIQAAGLAGTTHDAADLCTRIWRAGFRVVHEPDAVAFQTSPDSGRLLDGRAAYAAAHAEFLAARPASRPDLVIHARSPSRGACRILFVDDAIPWRRMGSGFVRSNDLLRAMTATGAEVTVFPMRQASFPLSICLAELPDTVEVIHEATEADFAAFMAARRDYYDIIWIARTHNLDRARETIAHPPLPMPSAGDATAPVWRRSDDTDETAARQPSVIVDTEAVTSVREAERAASQGKAFDLDAALREEFRHLTPEMHVIAVSEAEAALLREHHRGKIAVLGHAIAPSPTPRAFAERSGLLFVGAIHDVEDPNHDGLAWFIDAVLPFIEEALHWETRLTVAGYVAPGVSLDRFKGHPRVTLRGAAADLAPLYDSHRVFVAPARFAAGIPYKVHEAAAFGLPVVTTGLLARQLGWRDTESISAAEATDPAGFAARVVALYRDPALWTRLREAALAHVVTELNPDDFASRLAAVLRPG